MKCIYYKKTIRHIYFTLNCNPHFIPITPCISGLQLFTLG